MLLGWAGEDEKQAKTRLLASKLRGQKQTGPPSLCVSELAADPQQALLQ